MEEASQLLKQPVQYLKGVGPKKAAAYEKLKVKTAGDLIRFYPRDYLDFSSPVPVAAAVPGENAIIKGTVYKKQPEQRIRKGMSLFKVFVTDGEQDMTVTIFNSKYLYDSLELNKTYYFYGKISGNLYRKEMASPAVLPGDEKNLIRPIYHQTEGLTSKTISKDVAGLFSLLGDDVYDPMPSEITREYGLCHLRFALQNIHFPHDRSALSAAKNRLIFEEFLTLQLGLLRLKSRNRKETSVRISPVDLTPFYSALPFSLTGAQQRAVREAVEDMGSPSPMNRLLQGDVGSGKTAVAAALSFVLSKNGFQTALMAPTEILAEQHFHTLSKMLSPCGVKVCLLTGGLTPRQKADLKELIAQGGYSVVVGTHALVQDSVSFHRLGLVITDEQHRFGVGQRSRLIQKGDNPHVLVMSATPIPRTLALMIYGDLDISVLDELPKGRKPVATYAIDSAKRQRAFGYIKKHLDEGRQGYIVCPLIDEADAGELNAAVAYARRLSREDFKGYRVGLLHGRMKSAEKEAVMAAFVKGDIQLLVSTTVIEVGADVPNAVIMLIENAERFGLSQLHQLRGRVGRGEYPSTCILVSDHRGEETRRRLKVMCQTNDGFVISEEDLKMRGPGDFFGSRQHGLPGLKIASMAEDMEVLRKTQALAKQIISADPELSSVQNRGLAGMVAELFSSADQNSFN